MVKGKCAELNVACEVANVWGEGGEGAKDLAQAVVKAAESCTNRMKPIYDWKTPVKEKIEKVAKEVYGADGVEFTGQAVQDLKRIADLGLEHLPVCIAKTQYSFTDNPKRLGRPEGFNITIREIEIALGKKQRILHPEEKKKRLALRRSVFLTEDTRAGVKLKDCAIEFRRPGFGISPDRYEELLETQLMRDLAKGYCLKLTDLIGE